MAGLSDSLLSATKADNLFPRTGLSVVCVIAVCAAGLLLRGVSGGTASTAPLRHRIESAAARTAGGGLWSPASGVSRGRVQGSGRYRLMNAGFRADRCGLSPAGRQRLCPAGLNVPQDWRGGCQNKYNLPPNHRGRLPCPRRGRLLLGSLGRPHATLGTGSPQPWTPPAPPVAQGPPITIFKPGQFIAWVGDQPIQIGDVMPMVEQVMAAHLAELDPKVVEQQKTQIEQQKDKLMKQALDSSIQTKLLYLDFLRTIPADKKKEMLPKSPAGRRSSSSRSSCRTR